MRVAGLLVLLAAVPAAAQVTVSRTITGLSGATAFVALDTGCTATGACVRERANCMPGAL
jgi:hypothetical protein